MPLAKKILKKYWKIIFLVFLVGGLIYFQIRDARVTDETSIRVLRKSKELFEKTDRCDPFPCFDNFQIISIEKLEEPVYLANTCAAKLCVRDMIIESSKVLKGKNVEKKEVCQKGNYLVTLRQRKLFIWPVDDIRLCFFTHS
jgi:hypothetical protein